MKSSVKINIVMLAGLIAVGVGVANISKIPTLNATAQAEIQTPANQAKSDFQQLMWDAVDHYNTVKGAFIVQSVTQNTSRTIEFQVNENASSSYEKITTKDGQTLESRVDGHRILTKSDDKIIENAPLLPVDRSAKPSARLESKPDGTKTAHLRRDPAFTGFASEVTFPQEAAIGFLEDHSKWSFLGDEVFLGRSVSVVTGSFSPTYQVKLKASQFKLWVDKQTGMLLKYEYTDEKGQIVESLVVTSLQVNGNVDNALFQEN